MNGLLKDVLLSVGMGMVLPGVMLNFAVMLLENTADVPAAVVDDLPGEIQEVHRIPLSMRMRNADGTTSDQDMDAYLVGVVLAEMPAYFEEEALKAQAVVARTYTQKAYSTGGKHGDGSICTEPSCCQAYITESAYLERGGTREDVEKIRATVLETSGYVLTYEEQLIEATYFSCSGGSTEDAAAVWGTEYPYLQAVDSPGEEAATYYTDTAVYSRQQLEAALDITLSGNSAGWFSDISYTAGGGVDTVSVGGQVFEGTQIRKLLNLRSTAFSVSPDGNSVVITTRGFGHRVGMSQYGADAMALSGCTFAEILAHYYPGTSLTLVEN